MSGLFNPVDVARKDQETKERASRRKEPSISVSDMIMHTSQEARQLAASMADGPTKRNWEADEQGRAYTHGGSRTHSVRLHAEEGEELALVGKLIEEQGLDSAILLMYTLSCLSPDLDPNGRGSAWIDTAEAARRCGLLSHESKTKKYEARMKVTRTLIYGERATVVGKRTYRDNKKAEASSVYSAIWGVTDAEYLDGTEEQGGLPSDARRLPLNPVTPPVRCYVQLSARWRELLADPDWRQYLVGLRSVASIPSGQPSGQIARAIGFAFMCECRSQAARAAADIKAIFDGEEPRTMMARPRRWWLENFGVDPMDYASRPQRLVEYWAQALESLSGHIDTGGAELIARKGEAASASVSLDHGPEHRGWFQKWLDEPVRFTPGAALAPQLLRIESGEEVPVGVSRVVLQGRPGRPVKPKPVTRIRTSAFIPVSVTK